MKNKDIRSGLPSQLRVGEWYEITDRPLPLIDALDIMKYIENEMIKLNDECGKLHFDCDLRLWQDKQLELEIIERIYDELNSKFFDGKL